MDNSLFQALTSPISKYMPALLGSSFRNRPGGFALRICATKRAATCAFSNLRVRGSRYSRLYSSTMTRNVMFPGWLLMRPPRPQRTSFSLRSEMMPPWLGSTLTRGGGMDPPFARGILLFSAEMQHSGESRRVRVLTGASAQRVAAVAR